jgi:ABC-type dipeptide/oligopeptide/nickel transport system permease subunit
MTVAVRSRPLPRRRLPGRLAVHRFGASGVTALLVLLGIVLAVSAGPLLWTADPDQTDLMNKYAPFSRAAPLGTDEFGRDILSRILHGGRLSLAGALLVLLGSSGVGLLVGALAGSFGGWLDALLGRLIDGLLALPGLVVALGIVGVLGKSFENLLLALVLTGWPWYARIYRGFVLREQRQTYVLAATALGVTRTRIVWRHIGPNVVGPALVLATVNLGNAVLSLASLSFLGLGVQPPRAEGGAMVNGARTLFQTHPWLIVAPGLAISATVLAVNILGDALRDVADPRYRPR